MNKLHKPVVEAIIENLRLIFAEGKFADKVIASSLKKNAKWGSRDRKFIAETTYEIVRNYRILYSSVGTKNPWPLFAAYLVKREINFPEWKELNGLNQKNIKRILIENKGFFSIAQSIPDWLDELGRAELKDKWENEITALNQEAKVVLRTNFLKVSRDKLNQLLLNEGIETEPHKELPEALILAQRKNIFDTKAFKNGFFELQDVSSQRVAHFMRLKEGMRVVDACAGGGGKSLHIASLLKNKGKVISMDVRENKLEELKRRAARAGVSNIETRVVNDDNLKKLEGYADTLLLDVPCSGLGVLRRNPDAKWKLTPEKIIAVRELQKNILSSYSPIVKSGGSLVYATCSILPIENTEQIKKFLDSNKEFEMEEEKIIYPSEGFDGFYMCRLIRKK
ncbi:MAG: RsmB/NOP family class I SAM-dependent RNA methyltransferase [Bacteroidota bacterium]